ncbi:helix-turn-helix domain protein, partial [Actinobacteria bacterium OV320]
MKDMNNRSEVRDFLISRRGKVTPEQVGLVDHGGTRRVPGLRRSEVADLAGVSVEYYTQLERGNVRGASESVLDAVARALLLDEAERAHLFDLVRAANSGTAVLRGQRPQMPADQAQHLLIVRRQLLEAGPHGHTGRPGSDERRRDTSQPTHPVTL